VAEGVEKAQKDVPWRNLPPLGPPVTSVQINMQ
jgi:hypothetical protein